MHINLSRLRHRSENPDIAITRMFKGINSLKNYIANELQDHEKACNMKGGENI